MKSAVVFMKCRLTVVFGIMTEVRIELLRVEETIRLTGGQD